MQSQLGRDALEGCYGCVGWRVMGALLWRRLDALWGVAGAQVRCVVGRRGWRFVMWVHFGKISIGREGTIEIYILLKVKDYETDRCN